MANQDENIQNPLPLDISTRIRDLDEKSRLIRERVLLFGKNLIDIKEEYSKNIAEIKKEISSIKEEVARIKKSLKYLMEESSKFVKSGEMIVLERMLRDFRPLEFMRRKDVEKLIEEKMKLKK